jgi:hypothetical protein
MEVLKFAFERVSWGSEVSVVFGVKVVIDLLHFLQQLFASVHFRNHINVRIIVQFMLIEGNQINHKLIITNIMQML